MNNPIVRTPKVNYPITVKCVIDDLSEINPEILKVKEYVHSLNLTFIIREFNSVKYSDDRNNIKRLPAFHIYEKACYRKTFYLNTRPYQIIESILGNYKERVAIKEAKQQAWRKFFSNIIISLKKNSLKKNYNSVIEWP